MTRPFRFGVVAPLATDLPTWRDRVRRIADSGYSTLLMPDVPQWQGRCGCCTSLLHGCSYARPKIASSRHDQLRVRIDLRPSLSPV